MDQLIAKRRLIGPEGNCKEFTHKGVKVEERILDWPVETGTGSVKKIIWCRKPIYHTVVQMEHNFLFHHDFLPGDAAAEEVARNVVREEFDKYWNLA